MTLNILNVVQLGCQRVIDVNDLVTLSAITLHKGIDRTDQDLPVSLAFIKKSHDAQNLDLLDLTDVAYGFTNFANVKRVIVTLCFSLGVHVRRVFPSLFSIAAAQSNGIDITQSLKTNLRESSIVPNVTVVREAVANKAKFALFRVLDNWVERL